MADDAVPPLPGLVDDAGQYLARVVEQVRMARNTYRLRLHCPAVAASIHPGQFFMVRDPAVRDPLLGRPFALYDTVCDDDGTPTGIDFGYVVVGKLTSRMVDWQAGHEVEIWGPLGNGFPIPSTDHLVMVAGGIGQTPFLAVTREALGLKSYGNPVRVVPDRPAKLTLCYGARSTEYLAGVEDFEHPDLDIQIATDDGSGGHHGFVTELLTGLLVSPSPPTAVYTCGPEPMMEAAAGACAEHLVPCWASLETPMACGIGICFSCVAPVLLKNGDWDYKRTCVEGPVFRAETLKW